MFYVACPMLCVMSMDYCNYRDLLQEVSRLKEHQTMCQETIQAKDAVIVSLSEQLDKLTTDSIDPASNSAATTATLINPEESFHESVKVSSTTVRTTTVSSSIVLYD